MGNESKESSETDYWIKLTLDWWHDAAVLAKNGGSRHGVTDKCHGAMERSLKAVLSAQEKLSDSDQHHNLSLLAKKSEVYSELEKPQQSFLVKASGLHSSATYPADEITQRAWTDDTQFSIVMFNSKIVVNYCLAKAYKIEEAKNAKVPEHGDEPE